MFLVINLGLKSIRSIVFDDCGNQIYSKAFAVHTSIINDQVEQDVNEYNDLFYKLLYDLQFNAKLLNKIIAITTTTSSSCIFGMKIDGNPTTKVMMVSDKRAESILSEIFSNKEFIQLKEKDKPVCNSASLIPKALWFKKNESKIYFDTDYWIGISDYLNYLFTGKIITDPLNASKYFFQDGEYLNKVINSLGLNSSQFPDVLPIGSILELSDSLKNKYEFHKNCLFVLTTYDAICAVIGSSDGKDNNACDVSGTVTSVRLLTSNKDLNLDKNFILNQNISLINKSIIGSSNNLGGGIVEWYKQAFFENYEENEVYNILEKQAKSVPPGANGITFVPYLLGERSPEKLPLAFASFIGLNRNNNQNDITRSVFESCAFVTKGLLDLIESDFKIDKLTVSGGLARFDLINQIKSDVLNKPVLVLENFESTSIGALILIYKSLDVYDYNEDNINKIIRIKKIIYPSDSNNLIYKEVYSLFKEINNVLVPIYKKQNDINKKVSINNKQLQNL